MKKNSKTETTSTYEFTAEQIIMSLRLNAFLEAGGTVYIYLSVPLYNQRESEIDDTQQKFNYLYPGKLKFIVSEKLESGLIMTTTPRLDLSPHGHEF